MPADMQLATNEEKVEKELQKMVDDSPGQEINPSYLKTLSYQINDYSVNKLPDANPLQQTIDDFVKRRHKYKHDRKRGDPNCVKPQLEEFLKAF